MIWEVIRLAEPFIHRLKETGALTSKDYAAEKITGYGHLFAISGLAFQARQRNCRLMSSLKDSLGKYLSVKSAAFLLLLLEQQQNG